LARVKVVDRKIQKQGKNTHFSRLLFAYLSWKCFFMIAPNVFYVNLINDKSGYRATWNPNVKLEIGMIGKIDKTGVFNVYTTLEKEGIPVEVQSAGSTVDLDYTSTKSVSISSKLKGDAPVAGSGLSNLSAGFSVDFTSDNGVVFQSTGNRTFQLINLEEIEGQVLAKYKKGDWVKDYLIITQLVQADTATIIISNSSNVHLDLQATGEISAAALKLTNASLGLTVVKQQGSSMHYLAEKGLTPLYRVMGVHHPLWWWGEDTFDTKGELHGKAPEVEFSIQEFDSRELEQLEQ
jgi:hypothetical protein